MDRETLLEEINRLLDAGEPLLTVFPSQHSEDWSLQLPDNTSGEMLWYVRHVTWRAWAPKEYQYIQKRHSTVYLAELVNDFEAGLLSWRAIGVLR